MDQAGFEKELALVKAELVRVKEEAAEKEKKLNEEIEALDEALTVAHDAYKKKKDEILQLENQVIRLNNQRGRPIELEAKVEKFRAGKMHQKICKRKERHEKNKLKIKFRAMEKELGKEIKSSWNAVENVKRKERKLRFENRELEWKVRNLREESSMHNNDRQRLKRTVSDLTDKLEVAESKKEALKEKSKRQKIVFDL